MKNILIVGATSAIAIACARRWADQNVCFFLVARNGERLQQVADDLAAHSAKTVCYTLDIDQLDRHAAMFEHCAAALESIDIALVAPGTLPDQSRCEADPAIAVREFNTNAVSIIALLTPLANRLEAQRRGVLAVISSVAADRGRPSNYLYGSAKAALSVFCEGLRARLFKAGVHVLTIKPGFVATPMTEGLSMPNLLVATAERVAQDIVSAIDKRTDILYAPWFWSWIMRIIRLLPQPLFKRTSL